MTTDFLEILTYRFVGNSVKEYLLALAVFVLAIIILKIFKTVVVKKLKKLADHTKVEFDDFIISLIDSIGWSFYVFLSLYIAIQFIEALKVAEAIIFYAVIIIVAYYIVKGIQHLIDYGAQKIVQKRGAQDKKFDPSVINLFSKVLKVILWLIIIIVVLQNLGYNVSGLIAGLGIGGVAIAFALQNVLTDIFASFSIYLDRPFQVGDFIIVGDDMGVVKNIGIKSTRIQTLQGQELIMSNKELTEARVHNHKRMEKRRIVFEFGIKYETPTEKIKEIPGIVKSIIDKVESADIDRVHFNKFGDFSLGFEVVYFVSTSEYNKYMDIQQEINLTIKDEFEKEGIEMAYPTQTIFVSRLK